MTIMADGLVSPTPTAAVTDIIKSTILAALTMLKEKKDNTPTTKQPTKPERAIWMNKSRFWASSFSLSTMPFEDSICINGLGVMEHNGIGLRCGVQETGSSPRIDHEQGLSHETLVLLACSMHMLGLRGEELAQIGGRRRRVPKAAGLCCRQEILL